MPAKIRIHRDKIESLNLHLAGHCKDYLKLAHLAATAADRVERRALHNDTIQDIRLQRQARHLALDIIDLAHPHFEHTYRSHD